MQPVVFVELFYELHGLLSILKVCVVKALLVEVGDKRAVKVEMIVKALCEMLFVKIANYYSSIYTNKLILEKSLFEMNERLWKVFNDEIQVS